VKGRKTGQEIKWKKLTGLVNEQTDLLHQNFSEIKNELKDGREEFRSQFRNDECNT
jgi:hypothetical protein